MLLDADALFQTATNHHRSGEFSAAERSYRAVLSAAPEHADALHMLGVLLAQDRRIAEAIPLLTRAAEFQPGRPDILCNLGLALARDGRPREAESQFRQAISFESRMPEAHFNLGNVLKAQGRHPEAIMAYEETLRLWPMYARALFNLANALCEEGRSAAAVKVYRQVLSIRSDWGDCHLNLANALYDLRDLDAALEHYQHALQASPIDPAIADSIAMILQAQGRTQEALSCYSGTKALHPDDWPRELRRVTLMTPVPRNNDAIDSYRASVESHLHELADRRPTADVSNLHKSGAEPSVLLAYQGRDDQPLKKLYSTTFAAALPVCEPFSRLATGIPRSGIVVTRGHEGVFHRCFGELVARLDRRRLDVKLVCPRASANILRHLMPDSGLDYFVIPDRIDHAINQLREAGFHLLHYWEVGTDAMNYFLPYFRSAPIQTAGWGWPATTGIPAVDFFVSATDLESPDADSHYTEKLIRLPSLPTYYLRPPAPSKPADRARFGVQSGHHLYLCQQNVRKFHPDFDPILAEILGADPAGHLVLIADEQPRITEMLLARFRETMPEVLGRIHVAARMERMDYLGLVAAADVVLDTVHYGGGANTVYDAAACGTPNVTLPGPFHRSRWAAAVNRRLGVPELIAGTPSEYVQTAVRVASDTDFRSDLSQRISDRACDLFEDHKSVNEFQEFLLRAVG